MSIHALKFKQQTTSVSLLLIISIPETHVPVYFCSVQSGIQRCASHKRRLLAKGKPVSASPSTKPIFEKGGYLIKAIYSRPSSGLSLRRVLSCRWKNLQYPRRWHPANSRDKLLIIISILGEVASRPCRRLRSIHTSQRRIGVMRREIALRKDRELTILPIFIAETRSLYK